MLYGAEAFPRMRPDSDAKGHAPWGGWDPISAGTELRPRASVGFAYRVSQLISDQFSEKSMSRNGQGRHAPKTCIEQALKLDVRQLQRTGRLLDGMDYGWAWSRGGVKVATIDLSIQTDRVLVKYSRGLFNGQWQRTTCEVPLERTPCHLGGERVWWRCPVAGCNRRVAILYGGAGVACRHCHDLAYRCQRENAEERSARQANKVRRRLGWQSGILNSPGGKPKGMHWRTFDRLQATHDRHAQAALNHMAATLGSIQRHLERVR